jgi:hypothetical protein
MNGLNEFSPAEYNKKQEAIASAPRGLLSIVKGQIPDEYQLVDATNTNARVEFAYHMDAMNHLLALLNFPDKLRGFLDCILGLAKYNDSQEFTATNFQVGMRSRSGRAACSDDSMEKWVTRQKEKLNSWQSLKNFHLVKITIGEFDLELKRRKPTRYQVFFNKYVVETVLHAKTLWYWRDGAAHTKLQGRAIREAARIILNRIPEAPPLKLTKAKSIPVEEMIDRRDHMITTLLEQQRDDLSRLGLAYEEYFIKRQMENEKIMHNPPGLEGNLITPPEEMPDRRGNIVGRMKKGFLLVEPEEFSGTEFSDALENITGEEDEPEVFNTGENRNSLKTNDPTKGTFLSDQGDIFDSVKHFSDTNRTNLSVDFPVRERVDSS